MTYQQELTDTLENYLETILYLETNHKVARAKDIADRLQLQRGSVTSALKILADKGYINYEPYSFITLTPKGQTVAEEITQRHATIKNFLINVLLVDPETADETACRMEHAIDPQTLERLTCFIHYVNNCPRAGDKWIQSFLNFCAQKRCNPKLCQECIDSIKTEQ
ncbi:MAG: metal-dependent transcriptional regulator [Desulfobacteraceae bacterium]|nr:metal-dependent transcriptional regulator [Desulfobacteraceae bacterium]